MAKSLWREQPGNRLGEYSVLANGSPRVGWEFFESYSPVVSSLSGTSSAS